MITTSEPRRHRIFEIALVLSFVTHLLGLLVYLGFLQPFMVAQRKQQKEEFVAVSDVVRIEKRTVPREQVKRATVTPPVPEVVPRHAVVQKAQPRPKPVERREIARIAPQAPPRPEAAAKPVIELPSRAQAVEPRIVARNQTALVDQDDMDRRARRANAAWKADLANIPPPAQPPSTIRRRDTDIPTLSFRDLKRSEGVVDYIYKKGRYGNLNWYIFRARITYPDGKTELVDVPWPFYFPQNNDPIGDGSNRTFEAQAPPPGFALPEVFAPSRFVCSFFPERCQAQRDAEGN